MTESQKINGCVVHIITLAMFDLIKTAFALAAVSEPWVTKGLEPPLYLVKDKNKKFVNVDLEIEFLSYVEDENVIKILWNLNELIKFKDSFENINGITYEAIRTDREILDMAFEIADFSAEFEMSYDERVLYHCDTNYFIYLNIWMCTELINTQMRTIDESEEEVFNFEYDDYVYGFKKSDNSNVQLLYDLMAELTFHV